MAINQRLAEIISEYGSEIPEKKELYVDFLLGGVKGTVVHTKVVGNGYCDENLLAMVATFKAGEADIPIISGGIDDKNLIEFLSKQKHLKNPLIEIQGPFPDTNKYRAVVWVSYLRDN